MVRISKCFYKTKGPMSTEMISVIIVIRSLLLEGQQAESEVGTPVRQGHIL